MEMWESRWLHDKEVQTAIYKMHDLPVPEDIGYGRLSRTPNKLYMKWNGKKFFENFSNEHNSLVFEKCKCSKEK